ncbi:DUF317 domain-containing protein [Streptomyces sp. NPDC127098]|uniref:DUF317 domain-containing protein n=1 Tax=Streptomyces sp. NPDC127098 TaxID=3347137 RepID=UPI00365880F0
MPHFHDDDLVLVSPRYLAGGGGIADALGPLIHLFHWPTHHVRDRGQVTVTSPDGAVAVAFDPTRQDGVWWTVTRRQPSWSAEFTHLTPVEVIAAITQSLPQLLGDHRLIDRIGALNDAPDILTTARLNGWHYQKDPAQFTSPDGHCAVRHTPGADTPWQVTHSLFDGFNTHWTATFTTATPQPLINQFVTHLATSTPVERRYRDIPYIAREIALITPARGGPVNAHVHHALAHITRHTSQPPTGRRT